MQEDILKHEHLFILMACQLVLGYFMGKGLGNAFISHLNLHYFCMVVSKEIFFSFGPIECEQFLNRALCPIDGTLIGITTAGQSGPGSNDNESVHHSP